MKEQIKDFPEVLEIKTSFSEHDASYYHEIDLAINAEDCLFLIECKGTVVHLGEIPKLVQWSKWEKEQNDKFYAKGLYIKNYVMKNKEKDELFKNIQNFRYFQIKTEGSALHYGDMYVGTLEPEDFRAFLKKIRENINKGTFKSYMANTIKELGELGIIKKDD